MNRTRPPCRHRWVLIALLAVAGPFVAAAAAGQEWTRFRGPNGQGVAATDPAAIPVAWTPADYNWQTRLPGLGHSSPVLWGDRLFLLSADPDTATRYVLAIDAADGSILWTRRYPSTPHPLHLRSSYASSTPAVDERRVYVAWSTPDQVTLLALDHDGNQLWHNDLGPWVSQHGFGTSPIVHGELVILFNSQQARELEPGQPPGSSAMLAFDRRTGELRWETPRASTVVSYAVPCLYEPPAGDPQLIAYSTGDGIFSLDPADGRENWSIDVFRMRTVNSPVLAGGLILGAHGSGGGGNQLFAVRPAAGPGEPAELAYEVDRQAPYVPTPVLHDDLLFLFYDRGIVSCIQADDGKLVWRERLDTSFSGSPVRVGDRLYVIDDEGVVIVLAAARRFQELARNPLGEPSRATPAVSAGRIYFRTYSHLVSLGRGLSSGP